MAEEIIIDGLEEHTFRRSIEVMLRNGRADEAELRLKAMLPDVAGAGKPLPERLLEIATGDIRLGGWDQLAARIEEYSRPSIPITALGIGIGDPADTGLVPDALGLLRPPLATTYYSDATFPFSETDRADLLEGYTAFGCEWQGDHDRADTTLSIEGIDDLYGAIASLENEISASQAPETDKIRAGAIGACYLGVLIWQATRRAALEMGLPRPLAILLVNSDAYPFFDAPVMTCEEYLDDGVLRIVDHAGAANPEHRDNEEPEEAASLIAVAGAGAHREKTKKMALALDGDGAYDPIGMADELVAQAAFDPSSVDISRFMPDVSEFRNEPDEQAFEPHGGTDEPGQPAGDAVPDEDSVALPVEAYAEPEYPVDAAPAAMAEPQSRQLTADRNMPGYDPIGKADYSHSHKDRWFEAAASADAASGYRGKNAADAAVAAWSAETPMPWHEYEADLPFGPAPVAHHVRSQPASHSIRTRIRAASEEVDMVQQHTSGVVSAITRLFQWLRAMLLQR